MVTVNGEQPTVSGATVNFASTKAYTVMSTGAAVSLQLYSLVVIKVA